MCFQPLLSVLELVYNNTIALLQSEVCYWPSGTGVRKKVQKLEIPDKAAWKTHPVRLLAETGFFFPSYHTLQSVSDNRVTV